MQTQVISMVRPCISVPTSPLASQHLWLRSWDHGYVRAPSSAPVKLTGLSMNGILISAVASDDAELFSLHSYRVPTSY